MSFYKRIDMIACQMMKGANRPINGKEPNFKTYFENFKKKHKELLEWLVDAVPHKWTVAVSGALGKGVLWYGKEKIEKFCKVLQTGDFHGKGDPALCLLNWIMRSANRKNTNKNYRKTVTALRYFCNDRSLFSRKLRRGNDYPVLDIARTDLFEWNEDFTEMVYDNRTIHANHAKEAKETFPNLITDKKTRDCPIVNKGMLVFQCQFCEHTWHPRTNFLSRNCPKCRKTNWHGKALEHVKLPAEQ